MLKKKSFMKAYLFIGLMLSIGVSDIANAAANVKGSMPLGEVSGADLKSHLPGGTGLQPFIRYNINFLGSNPNTNTEQSGLNNNSAIMNMNCDQSYQTINLANGQNYMTVPIDGVFYLYMNATTQNQNAGSGEWNNVQFNLYATPPGQSSTGLCTFTVNQKGGGSDVGTGFTYFNEIACPPVNLKAGTLIFVQAKVVSSGTHCGGNSVFLMGGSVSLQSMPY
jgi:hypothetical protein